MSRLPEQNTKEPQGGSHGKSALGRFVFGILVLCIWVAAAWAVLELHFAWRWRSIQRTNPYVLARESDLNWPNMEFTDAFPEWASQPAAYGLDKAFAPASAEEVERIVLSHRARYFEAVDIPTKAYYSDMLGEMTALVDETDGPVFIRLPFAETDVLAGWEDVEALLGDDFAREVQAALREVLRSGEPKLQHIPRKGVGPVRGYFFPGAQTNGVAGCFVTCPESPARSQGTDLWEIPFFAYRRHAPPPDDTFYINNFGFRDTDVAAPRPPGVFRIVCVGGSTTEGGDTNETSYPNLLERRLNLFFGTRRIEVINCGITGIDSLKERLRAADYLALDPDLIVYYNGVNDLCYGLSRQWVKDAALWKRVVRRSRFLNYHLDRWLMPGEEGMATHIRGATMSNLRHLRTYAASQGVDVAFCTFASPDINQMSSTDRDYFDYFNVMEWGGRYVTFATYCRAVDIFNRELAVLGEESGIPLIPVAEHIKGGTDYFGDICHMKNSGIALKAETIARYLVDHYDTVIRERIAAGE